MTGATFAVQQFSEHEECRCCLEPGIKVRECMRVCVCVRMCVFVRMCV